MEPITFHIADYVVFGASLFLSAAIGIHARFTGDRQSTTKEFLMGNKELHSIPVALSLQASFMSAIFILGTPAEIYMNGTMYSWILVSYFIALPIVAIVFLPVFHRLDITSAYEALEKRYNKWIRLCGSMAFALMMILYMAVVLYTPALAFSQVTGLSMLVSILGIGVVCTFYTVIGGLKAVVWTDAFQMLIIYVGLFALLIAGTIAVGGPSIVYEKALIGGRLQYSDISIDPRVRHTVWSQIFGGALMTLSLYAANQAMIQRYLSINKMKHAQRAVYFSMFSTAISMILVTVLGLVMYAYYFNCDPIKFGRVQKTDQLTPLFVMDVLGHLHGMAGLFTAATFSAALSTVSSGVNSLAAVFLCDVVTPLYSWHYNARLSDQKATLISKVLALLFGLITIALGFSAGLFGKMVLQIALSIFGVVGGPLLGVFCLAFLFPSSNSWGAFFGLMSSLVVGFWMQLGAIIYPSSHPSLETSISECSPEVTYNGTTETMNFYSFETSTNHTLEENNDLPKQGILQEIYSISYMWYSVITVLTTILVGMLFSAITGFQKKRSRHLQVSIKCQLPCCCCYRDDEIEMDSLDEIHFKPISNGDAKHRIPEQHELQTKTESQ